MSSPRKPCTSKRMCYKQFDGIKAIGEEPEYGKISGHASAFDVVDEVFEVVQKGAFHNSIMDKGQDRVILYQHDTDSPIGKARIFEDEKGLGFEGTIITSTSKGHDTYELIKNGVLSKMSIGFNVIEDEWKNGVRFLKEIDLWEISVVTFPANDEAEVMAMKSIDLKRIGSWKDTVLTEDLLEDLTDEDILNAEKVIKRIKEIRDLQESVEDVIEDEKSTDEEEEKTDEEEDEKEGGIVSEDAIPTDEELALIEEIIDDISDDEPPEVVW